MDIVNAAEEQLNVESALLINDDTCQHYQAVIRDVNSFTKDQIREIYDGTRYRFFDYNFMQTLGCSLSRSFNQDFPKVIRYVKNSVDRLIRIGEESVDGFAWKANFRDYDDMVVIKTPKTVESDLRLIHELFVATFCTNLLRMKIPNFMFIYGVFECTKPKIGAGNSTTYFCMNNGKIPVNYLMLEYINGDTFAEFILKAQDVKDIILSLVQIAVALDYAYRTCEFCHYDLHTNNILMRFLPGNKVKIPTQFYRSTDQRKFKIRTNYIPTIIDYGRSHIVHEGVHYGEHDVRDIYPDRARPMFDLFRLIGSMLYELYYKNPQIFDQLAILLNYFPHFRRLNVTLDEYFARVEYANRLGSDIRSNEKLAYFVVDEYDYPDIDDLESKNSVYRDFFNYMVDNFGDYLMDNIIIVTEVEQE
jgi:hypothetical protein